MSIKQSVVTSSFGTAVQEARISETSLLELSPEAVSVLSTTTSAIPTTATLTSFKSTAGRV
ncbi:hypothetical protein [Halorubrum halophilum]|uniref:hypothetical protein n=1 Tax=Halorubrum halophilum TaxID=413816 RepID=UPI0012AB77A5|nr:hypothetical protein [Halorubrum halophilum]